MSKAQSRRCTCIYCGESFFLREIKWRISDNATRHASNFEKSLCESLDRALERFRCADNVGRAFFSAINGEGSCPKTPEKIRLVIPADFKSNKNRFSKNSRYGDIWTFKEPDLRDPNYPTLHFSGECVRKLNNFGRGIPETVIEKIERDEIYPVCPFCISDLPRELLRQKEPVHVIKLGFIGPAESGKTSLNVINILFECLDCGGWEFRRKDLYVTPHYLLKDNYYKSIFDRERLPPPTPDCYIPPLLLQLKRGSQNVLLSLLDIPARRLKTLLEDVLNQKSTRQTDFYMKLFGQMDGWLLMLDAEREVLPKIDSNEHGAMPEEQETLEYLLKIFSKIPEWQRKPAALVITKCDQLFIDALGKEKSSKLFGPSNSVELMLWQKPLEFWQRFNNLEQEPRKIWQQRGKQEPSSLEQQMGKKDFYSVDRHEIVQYLFKPLIRENFSELTNQLNRYFSEVDIFPESNWGSFLEMPNIQEKLLDKEWVKPFYSAEPIFWLLDIIQRGVPPAI